MGGWVGLFLFLILCLYVLYNNSISPLFTVIICYAAIYVAQQASNKNIYLLICFTCFTSFTRAFFLLFPYIS